jgi:hypothetical protein
MPFKLVWPKADCTSESMANATRFIIYRFCAPFFLIVVFRSSPKV